jgi:hypothetical protein
LVTDSDGAIAFGPGTPGSQWTVRAILTGIDVPVGDIAIGGGIARNILKVQAFVSRTNEPVVVDDVREVLDAELVGTQHFGIAVIVGILVKCVVLEEVFHLVSTE